MGCDDGGFPVWHVSRERTKRPWAEPLKETLLSDCIFDQYPKERVDPQGRELIERLINEIGNRQYDASAGVVMST